MDDQLYVLHDVRNAVSFIGNRSTLVCKEWSTGKARFELKLGKYGKSNLEELTGVAYDGNDGLYVTDNKSVVRLQAQTGEKVWTTRSRIFPRSPISLEYVEQPDTKGYVLLVDGNCQLEQYDAATGELLHSYGNGLR